MRSFCALLVLVVAVAVGVHTNAAPEDPKVISLWPGPPPGSENWNYDEISVVGPQDHMLRISNITRPTLTIYLPDPAHAVGTGVVICPGGGFRFLAFDHEGVQLAKWLNAQGVAAFILKYRVMRTGD